MIEDSYVRKSRSENSALPQLTDREFEVFQLIGQARSNREIAEDLHLSPKTVETHRLNLMSKLKVKNRAELLRFALQHVEKEAGGA